ncbi:hypothetical protein WR25_17089 isoform B [Diploscapter pachys]|uniref:Uncharacterized protein n=1 Tax=Diploscapter pachys TaxID=2018661 RepID=A0A2A2JAE8_9BILA|nr:hypothetical protein WR25_17089 isoform B [Diploscapter pachys]
MWRLNLFKSGSSLPGLTRSGLPTARLKLSTSAKSQAEFEQLQSDESFIIHDWLERFGPEVNKSLKTLHSDRPVVEIISFDDFGGLFLRNVHPSTFSSPEEIVEAFQRVESISPPEFRDSLVVPDRIDTSELGNGSDEVEIEAEQLREEADIPDITLQFMQESDDSDLALASLCSSQPGPSTSAVSSSSTAPSKPHPPSTRRVLSDKIRSVRRHHLSTKTANNSENLPALPQSIPVNLQLGRISKSFNIPPSILETDPPIFVPRDPKLVVLPVKTEATRIKEKKKNLASVEDLKLLVSQGNITEFSLTLAEKRILKSANLKFSFSVFGQFIVEKAEKAEEAMGVLKNLLILDSTATLPASIVWVLIRRLCEESGPVGLKEQIDAIHAEFMTRTHFSKKIKNEVFDEQRLLYSIAWTKDSNSALDLFEAMTQLGFDRNAESFLHEGVTVMYKEKSSFSEIFSRWQPLSSRYSTTAGSSVVWQALLREEESQTNKQFGKSISKELNHFEMKF